MVYSEDDSDDDDDDDDDDNNNHRRRFSPKLVGSMATLWLPSPPFLPSSTILSHPLSSLAPSPSSFNGGPGVSSLEHFFDFTDACEF